MTSNPYAILSDVNGLFSIRADLYTPEGVFVNISPTPETPQEWQEGAGGVNFSVAYNNWTISVHELKDDNGTIYQPRQGDRLVVHCDDNRQRVYIVTANERGATWEWVLNRAGYRMRFFTKYAEA